MSWVRLDDGFMEHAKVIGLPPRDIVVHLRALCYAARRRDPHITPAALPLLVATPAIAQRLTGAGLWDRNSDGWVIHDWDDYQPASNADRQRRYRDRKRGDDE